MRTSTRIARFVLPLLCLGVLSCDLRDKGPVSPSDRFVSLAPRLEMRSADSLVPVIPVDSVRFMVTFGGVEHDTTVDFNLRQMRIENVPVGAAWTMVVQGLRKAADGRHWPVWWQGSQSGSATVDSVVVQCTAIVTVGDTAAPVLAGTMGIPTAGDTLLPHGTARDSIGFVLPATDTVYANGSRLPGKVSAGLATFSIGFALPDTLALVLVSSSGIVTMDTLVFSVSTDASTDPSFPTIAFSSPKADTTLATSPSSFDVTVAPVSASGIDSVVVDGVALKTGSWTWTVPLHPGPNLVQAEVFAHNGKTAGTSLWITLPPVQSGDKTPPSIHRTSPASQNDTLVFPWGQRRIDFSWSVTDSGGVRSVWLDNDSLPPPAVAGGSWNASEPLVVGANRFVLRAVDLSYNLDSSVVVVVRQPDTTHPVVVWQGSQKQDSIAFGATEYLARWSVTDSDTVVDVSVNGVEATVAGSIYTATLPLGGHASKGYTLPLHLVAVDRNADTTRDTAILHVLANTGSPTFSVAPTVVVPYGSTIDSLRWSAIDSDTVVSVTASVVGTSGSAIPVVVLPQSGIQVQCLAAIPITSNPVVVELVATNAAGNKTTTPVTITTAAKQGAKVPLVTRVYPDSTLDTLKVSWGTKSITFAWNIVDGGAGVGKVLLNDTPLVKPGSGTTWTSVQPLVVGTKVFRLQVTDSLGESVYNTVVVARAALAPPTFKRSPTTKDTVLLDTATGFTPSWTISDSALQSVVIGGDSVAIPSTKVYSQSYSRTVPISGDSIWIAMVATDASGSTVADSIHVYRLAPPKISPHGDLLSGGLTETAHIVSNLPGATVSYSPNGTNWTDGASVLVSKSQKLYAKASFPGVTSALDSAFFLYPPTFSPSTGVSADTLTVTVMANGAADSVQWSTDNSLWHDGSTPTSASASIQSDTLYARSYLGGVASSVAKSTYTISHDASLKSISVTPFAGAVQGNPTTVTVNANTGFPLTLDTLDNGTTSATFSVTTTDPYASYHLIDGPTLILTGDSAIEHIQVVNGPVTENYSVRILAKKYGIFSDGRDGTTYRYVNIGSQRWMAENLNYGGDTSVNHDTGACYGNDPANCKTYGRLYAWHEVMAVNIGFDGLLLGISDPHQGICPDGWHVPTESDWTLLAKQGSVALKANSDLWNPNFGADNFGFGALPGGYSDGTSFSNVGSYSYFWTSTEVLDPTDNHMSSSVQLFSLESTQGSAIGDGPNSKSYKASLRCIYGAGS